MTANLPSIVRQILGRVNVMGAITLGLCAAGILLVSVPAPAADEISPASAATMTTDDGATVYCVTEIVEATDGTTYGAGFIDCPADYVWPTAADTDDGDSESLAFTDIVKKGRGDKVLRFTVPGGAPAIATISHAGKSNFAVTSVLADGSTSDLLVNEIGKYDGTRLINVYDGEGVAAFRIEADGKWKITVKPLTSARKWDTSGRLTGKGDDVVWITPETDGLASMRIQNKGQSNFAVFVYTIDGERDLLVNEIGRYDGEVLLPDGSLLLQIDAVGGTWSMSPPQ